MYEKANPNRQSISSYLFASYQPYNNARPVRNNNSSRNARPADNRQSSSRNNNSLVVANLHFNVTEKDLYVSRLVKELKANEFITKLFLDLNRISLVKLVN